MDNFVTFNCRSIKKNIHIVRALCNKYDIIALQETFLPQQECHFLGSVHPNFNYVASSPVDLSQRLLRGRPYGGLASLFNEKIAPNIQVVPTSDERLLCIDIDFNDDCIRLINCYMPYYNGANLEE